MSRAASSFLAVFGRNLRSTWTAPVWVLFSLSQPLLWLVLFGRLFGSIDVDVGRNAVDYFTFFAPGMLSATTAFGALWTGIGLARDRETGMLRRVLASAAPRPAVMTAYVVQSLAGVLLQAVIVLGVSVWMGAALSLNALTILLVLAVLALLGFCISALSHTLALLFPRQETLVSSLGFMTLPILFLSSALFPLGHSPHWMRVLAQANPIHHGGELVRLLTIPTYESRDAWFHVAYLAGAGIVFLSSSVQILKSES